MKTFREIRKTLNHFGFLWATQIIMEKGLEQLKQLTDEEIDEIYKSEISRQEQMKGLCIYTPELVRDVMIACRDFAQLPFDEVLNGLVREDGYKAYNIHWDRLVELATRVGDFAMENCEKEEFYEFLTDCDVDADEAKFLWEIEDLEEEEE